MIIDTFLLNDELDMLEFRLKILWPVVDKFVIVESTHTFSGKPKKLNFDAIRFEWAKDKIVYHIFTANTNGLDFSSKPDKYDPFHDCWQLEYRQRNAIADALSSFGNTDIVIMGDIDEIPSRECVSYIISKGEYPVVCNQAFFYYNCNRMRLEEWNGSIICPIGYLRNQSPQALRDKRNILKRISPAGWHLSYFGDIKNKIESFSHAELNIPEYKDDSHIARCIKNGDDLFNRGIKSARINQSFFPQYFIDNAPKEWF